jgi:hypothetical protein
MPLLCGGHDGGAIRRLRSNCTYHFNHMAALEAIMGEEAQFASYRAAVVGAGLSDSIVLPTSEFSPFDQRVTMTRSFSQSM